MVIDDVVWQKSKISQLRGTLTTDGGNLAFHKSDEPENYISGYTIGNTTYVKKDEYFGRKLNSFLGKIFKKVFGVKEDFTVAKSDVRSLKSLVMKGPKFDYQQSKMLEDQFTYTAQISFTANGAEYGLMKNFDAEDEAKAFENCFK